MAPRISVNTFASGHCIAGVAAAFTRLPSHWVAARARVDGVSRPGNRVVTTIAVAR